MNYYGGYMNKRNVTLAAEQVRKGKAHTTWVNEILAHFGCAVRNGMVRRALSDGNAITTESARYCDLAQMPKHDLIQWLER
jgi:hypothetical protein